MKTIKKLLKASMLLVAIALIGCAEEEFSFGAIESPVINSIETTQPATTDADFGSGEVTFKINASNALSYLFYPGDGSSRFLNLSDLDANNSFKHVYSTPGQNDYDYTLVVNGQAGVSSNLEGAVTVFTALDDNTQAVIDILSGNGTKAWKWDNSNQAGWYGVGPGGVNLPASGGDLQYWWAPSGPEFGDNDCLFNDQLVFTLDAATQALTLQVENQGDTFYHDDYTAGIEGGSNTAECLDLVTEPTNVTVGNIDSELLEELTTGISLELGGDGFLSFYIANSPRKYEILDIDCNSFSTRIFFWDDEEDRFNAWYQRFTTVVEDTDCTAVVE